MNFGGDHPAPGHGKISPRCVLRLPAMARLCPDAFPKGPRTGKTPVRGNISPPCIQIQLILARYARYVSEKPRRAPLGNAPREHLAAKGRFRRPKPPDHARRTNLAALRWTCPCAGAPARAAASRDRLSTAWPLPRGACPGAPPMPATCQCLPLAVPVAARGKPPMGFGGGHPAHGLQSGQAPRGRRLRHLDGRAGNGVLRRTGPGFQNREQVGAEPQAETAGPAGPASALPKTPIERTSPSWRNYRNTPKNSHQSCFLRLPLAEFAPVAVSPTVPQLRQEFSQHKRHAGFLGLPFDQFAPVVLTVVPVGFTAPMPCRAFLGCISPVRTRAVRDLLVLLRLLRLAALGLATRIEMMTQSIA